MLQEASAAATKSAERAEGVEVDLLDLVSTWLTPSVLLLALASGQLLLLSLEVAAGAVHKIGLQKASNGPVASCACRLGQSHVFLGSWAGDSLLLHAAAGPAADKVAAQPWNLHALL